MNPRDQKIVIALLSAVILGAGAFLFYEFYLVPLAERTDSVRKAQEQVDEKLKRINEVAAQKPELARLSKWSLPGNVAFSGPKYVEYLNKMIEGCGIGPLKLDVKPTSAPLIFKGDSFNKKEKEPFLTTLSYSVTGQIDLPHLLNLLEKFYSAPLLHRIRLVSITRPNKGAEVRPAGPGHKSTELEIHLEVQALIVQGAENREEIEPKASSAPRNLPEPPRDYRTLAETNIFYGPPPPPPQVAEGPDPTKTVELTSITRDDQGHYEVELCDRADSKRWCLKPDNGIDIFEIKNKHGQVVVQGEVTRVGDRDIVFRAGDRLFSMHFGETLEKALRTPLNEASVRALNLRPTLEKNGAQ